MYHSYWVISIGSNKCTFANSGNDILLVLAMAMPRSSGSIEVYSQLRPGSCRKGICRINSSQSSVSHINDSQSGPTPKKPSHARPDLISNKSRIVILPLLSFAHSGKMVRSSSSTVKSPFSMAIPANKLVTDLKAERVS